MKAPHVMACIDGSNYAETVSDAAIWASQRMEVPLSFVHVLDRNQAPSQFDPRGNIGLGSREHLLEELASLDEQRGKLAQEHGRLMLSAARERAEAAGIAEVETRQRNGELVEALVEIEEESRLVVLGKRGESAEVAPEHMGSNLERVIRGLHRPILVVPETFTSPSRYLIAFDGGPTTRKMVELLAERPLLRGLECHLVLVGADTDEHREQLAWAEKKLAPTSRAVHTRIIAGEVEKVLCDYQREHATELLVMGAYGHSRIRQFLVGSTTTAMIRRAQSPLLLLR